MSKYISTFKMFDEGKFYFSTSKIFYRDYQYAIETKSNILFCTFCNKNSVSFYDLTDNIFYKFLEKTHNSIINDEKIIISPKIGTRKNDELVEIFISDKEI